MANGEVSEVNLYNGLLRTDERRLEATAMPFPHYVTGYIV
jgi:hypothetical protein